MTAHEAERKHVRDYLFHQHEDDPHRFPQSIVFDLWEELWARWWDELRVMVRTLLREMGTDTPSRDEFTSFALMPTGDGRVRFSFPTVFDLEDPNAYYQVEVVPRLERTMHRMIWQMTHQGKHPGGRQP